MAKTQRDDDGLSRFVGAQNAVYAVVVAELRAGMKTTHWMWFIFPQLRDLGVSPMSSHYGIGSLEEARAYLAHPLLGPRLRECAEILLDSPSTASAAEILGATDAMKLRSSMTLFAAAAQPRSVDRNLFRAVLDRFYGGESDPVTERLLATF